MKSKVADSMEKVGKTEDQLNKIREKKKSAKEKKRMQLKERKFLEKKEMKPKKTINNHFMGKKEKKKLKKKILQKNMKLEDHEFVKIVKLNELDTIEGRILGSVKEILEWGMILELPNGLNTSVHITQITDVYSELMEKFSSGAIDEIPELSNLYSIGDLVIVKLIECITNSLGQKQMKGTLCPHQVNEVYTNTSLESGLVLPACVRSKEDHGYLLDLGVKNTRTFIRYDSVTKPLFVGQIVTCLITNIKMAASMSIVEVTLDEELIAESRLSPSQVSLLSLVPGMTVTANIIQDLPQGWKVKLKHTQFKGFLAWEQMSNVHNAKYLKNKQVDLECTVLYVSPRQFIVYLGCNEALLTRQSSTPEYRVGSFVQDGVITRVEPQGLYFQCEEEDNVRGFISQYQGGCKPELFQAKFRLGEVIKECRIIDHLRLDNVYLASLNKKVLTAVSSTEELNLGDLVSCVVKGISERGVICQVGYYKLRATCENEYVQGNKEQLRIGDEVQARVIRIDSEENSIEVSFKSVYLHAEPLSTVKNSRPGKLVWGILVEKLPHGVRVQFENEINGVFHTKHMDSMSRTLFYSRFKTDTVIACQILSYEDGDLLLSYAEETQHPIEMEESES
uniref:Protein RRP5 homolog n=1 Tax=Cacopsylla melanoneura TaxID=428564 RepID=A0A8D8SQA9_9HEMI